MCKGSHPRILENIFSVIQVPRNPQNNTKHCFAMTPAKFGTRQLLAVPRRCHQLRLTCGRQRGSRLTQSIFQCNLSFQTIGPFASTVSPIESMQSIGRSGNRAFFPQTGQAEWMKFQERTNGADALAYRQPVGASLSVSESLQWSGVVGERSPACAYEIEGWVF